MTAFALRRIVSLMMMFLMPTAVTMVVGFQAAKVSFGTPIRATKSQSQSVRTTTISMVEMFKNQKTSNIHNAENHHIVDSSRNLWLEKSVQVVSSLVVGWTLATSMAMATDIESFNMDKLSSSSAMVPTVVVTTTMEMSADSTMEVTDSSSIPTINEVAVETMLVNTGTSLFDYRQKNDYGVHILFQT
jgi:hypothetical protein